MEHFVATLTVCMGERTNGKEEGGKRNMANAASSKVKPRTLNFSAAAAKRDEEVNQKKKEKKGVHSKKREEKTENDCFSFIKMSFY